MQLQAHCLASILLGINLDRECILLIMKLIRKEVIQACNTVIE